MGDKIEARKVMEGAGIPVVPGVNEALKDGDEAVRMAPEIGFPIMLKASAIGGGIGLQLARNVEELKSLFKRNQKQAQTFFSDDTMYFEKYVENPRHIEFQILVDARGDTVH